MQTTKQKIDLEVLPEEAKKELIDFYEVIKFLWEGMKDENI